MAKASLLGGKTSNIFLIFIQDNTSTTGVGKTGLLFSGITGYYKRSNGTAAVQITMATITTLGTFASGGLKEVDATNMPGVYEIHPPDAAFASGAKSVVIMYKGGTNMAPVLLEIELTTVDNQDSVRGGMTALPNAAASAVGGLPVAVDTSGRVDVLKINGTSQTAGDVFARIGAPVGASISADIAAVPNANANADALLDRAAGIETNRTPRQGLRLMLAALMGKASGLATTTAVYRDTNDSKNRISATVDADGNRSAVTLDAT